jgi:hypothetical protein
MGFGLGVAGMGFGAWLGLEWRLARRGRGLLRRSSLGLGLSLRGSRICGGSPGECRKWPGLGFGFGCICGWVSKGGILCGNPGIGL